jgi:uncharacterized oxidoreductase
MKVSNNTVLITGGGSGIGYETAKLFSERNNRVIICGRNHERLQEAASRLKNVTAIPCDITQEAQVSRLVERLNAEHKDLNLLFNNAGLAYLYSLSEDVNAYQKASEEMNTNFLSAVRLTEKLLPLLRKQAQAAIINNTSVVAFAPGALVPTYSATKAALHSYSQTLRLILGQTTNIRVFEVMPPLVDTEFSREVPGDNRMLASEVAREIIKGLSEDVYEMRVGFTQNLYELYLQSPEKAFLAVNGVGG